MVVVGGHVRQVDGRLYKQKQVSLLNMMMIIQLWERRGRYYFCPRLTIILDFKKMIRYSISLNNGVVIL